MIYSLVQNKSVRSCFFYNTVFSEMNLFACCCAFCVCFQCCDKLVFLCSYCSVRCCNVLICINFKHCTRQTAYRIFRLIYGRKCNIISVFISISAADCSYIRENITCFFYGNCTFLRSIFLIDFYDCNAVFFTCVFCRNIKIYRCAVEDISVRSLHFND